MGGLDLTTKIQRRLTLLKNIYNKTLLKNIIKSFILLFLYFDIIIARVLYRVYTGKQATVYVNSEGTLYFY